MNFQLATTASGGLILIPPTGADRMTLLQWEEELTPFRFFEQHLRFVSETQNKPSGYAILATDAMAWCAAKGFTVTLTPEIVRLISTIN
jgi:hypothetical protein